jgi:hypothetical protein
VHGEQAFLDKVFHFIGPAEKALAQKCAQVRAEFLQEFAISRCVAGKAAQEQAPQRRFGVAQSRPAVHSVSCHRTGWLQPFQEKGSGGLCRHGAAPQRVLG